MQITYEITADSAISEKKTKMRLCWGVWWTVRYWGVWWTVRCWGVWWTVRCIVRFTVRWSVGVCGGLCGVLCVLLCGGLCGGLAVWKSALQGCNGAVYLAVKPQAHAH